MGEKCIRIGYYKWHVKALIEAKELEQDPFESLQSIISWEQFVQSVEHAVKLASKKLLTCFSKYEDASI
jgi:hypothetical protein